MFRKIAQNRITQKWNSAFLREMKFANDCAKCFFSRKNVTQRKQKFSLSFAKIANGNPNRKRNRNLTFF